MKKLILPLMCCLLASPIAGALAADAPLQSVTVNGVRNPELRSYRTLVAGLDGFVARAAITGVAGGADWCEAKGGQFWHAAPAIINGASIVSGSRRAVLKSKDESFLPPLADTSWPDDALIELDIDAAPQG